MEGFDPLVRLWLDVTHGRPWNYDQDCDIELQHEHCFPIIPMKFQLKKSDLKKEKLRDVIARELSQLCETFQGQVVSSVQIHSMRRSLKKTRALLRLVRDGISASDFRETDQHIRQCGKLLAPIRDAWVLESLIEKLDGEFEIISEDTAKLIQLIRDSMPESVKRIEATTPKKNGTKFNSRLFIELKLCLHETIQSVLGWSTISVNENVIKKGISRVYRKARKHYRNCSKGNQPSLFHEWRRSLKQLFYHCQLAPWAWRNLDEWKSNLRRLERTLGDEHDLVVLQEFLQSTEPRVLSQSALDTALEKSNLRRHKLQRKSLRMGEHLFTDPGLKFVKKELF